MPNAHNSKLHPGLSLFVFLQFKMHSRHNSLHLEITEANRWSEHHGRYGKLLDLTASDKIMHSAEFTYLSCFQAKELFKL